MKARKPACVCTLSFVIGAASCSSSTAQLLLVKRDQVVYIALDERSCAALAIHDKNLVVEDAFNLHTTQEYRDYIPYEPVPEDDPDKIERYIAQKRIVPVPAGTRVKQLQRLFAIDEHLLPWYNATEEEQIQRQLLEVDRVSIIDGPLQGKRACVPRIAIAIHPRWGPFP